MTVAWFFWPSAIVISADAYEAPVMTSYSGIPCSSLSRSSNVMPCGE